MSDKPLNWPYVAADARDRAAESAVTAIYTLEPIIAGVRSFSELERCRREASALANLYQILRLLESVGAKTRP